VQCRACTQPIPDERQDQRTCSTACQTVWDAAEQFKAATAYEDARVIIAHWITVRTMPQAHADLRARRNDGGDLSPATAVRVSPMDR
jgi:hypothetical protein